MHTYVSVRIMNNGGLIISSGAVWLPVDFCPLENISLIRRCHQCLFVCLLICLFVCSRIFHSFGDVSLLINALSLWGFEQGRIFIVPHLLWQRTSVLRSHSKDHANSDTFNDKQGIRRTPPPYKCNT